MRVMVDTPRLTDGVSQQPDSRRFRSQAERIKNAWLSVVDGLDKRNGSTHVARLYPTGLTFNYWNHWMDRLSERSDPHPATGTPGVVQSAQRYLFVGQQPQSGGALLLKAYDLQDGSELHVEDTASAAPGGTLGGSAPTFDYLSTSGMNASARETLKLLSIADHTFVVNRDQIAAMDTTPISTAPANGIGFISVRAGNYSSDYTVTVTTSVTGVQTVEANTWNGTGSEPASPPASPQNPISIRTEDIAEELRFRLNALTGITATRVGSVIKIVGNAEVLTAVEVHDSVGDTNLVSLFDNITTAVDLPLTCEHDFKIRVIGDANIGGDDYIIQFVAEAGSGFGPGSWEQGVAHGSEYLIDSSTMPHRLVRMVSDGSALPSGYSPGNGDVYFEFSTIDWGQRVTGDEDLVPDPSFIGNSIVNVFLVRNRLGLLADDNIVLSEVNGFFNFFRTDLTNLLDSDPIDVAIGHTDISYPQQAVPFENDLIVGSDRNQFRIPGEIELTPKTVGVRHITSFLMDTEVQMISTDTGLYFSEENDGFSLLREMYRRGDSVLFDSANLSEQTPRYIPGRIRELTASSNSNAVAVVLNDADSEDRDRLFIYQFHWSGNERVQSAWQEWSLGAVKIMSAHFYEDKLYLLVERDSGVYLEYIDTSLGGADTQQDFRVKMDRKALLTGAAATYDSQTNLTRWTLPWDTDESETVQVLTWSSQASPLPKNAMLNIAETNIDTPGAHYIDVVGDWTGLTFAWVGVRFDMEYEFGSILFKEETDRGERAISSGPNQVYDGLLAFENAGPFEVEVTPRGQSAFVYESPVRILDDVILGGFATNTVLSGGEFLFPVLCDARSVTVVIRNRLPYPAQIQRAEWSVELRPRHRRG